MPNQTANGSASKLMNKSLSITYSFQVQSSVSLKFSSGSLRSRRTRFPCLQSCWTAEWSQAISVSAHLHTHTQTSSGFLLNLQTDIQGHKLSCDLALFIRETNRWVLAMPVSSVKYSGSEKKLPIKNAAKDGVSDACQKGMVLVLYSQEVSTPSRKRSPCH